MARRYEIDELIQLRSSPLVVKPPGLPPIEEWMPQPDPTTQRKQQNTRDPHNPSETPTARRPSLFEARHIPRGSNSEDIILGPPKTAFASSRIGGKGSFDLTDRSTRPGDSEEKSDRFNFRDRFSKDKDIAEKDLDRRDGKTGLTGRRGEKEDWNAGRPRRTFGPEDPERRPRRTGEFDRWENRENPREANAERGARDREARFAKKDGAPGRAKFEGSWFRDEHGHDVADGDEDKPLRNREWRRNQHGADRDWQRGAKIEQDPEWMDSNDRDEPRRAHTQEDFERWKERMKAGSGAAQQAAAHEEREEVHEEPSYASHHYEPQLDTPSKNAASTHTDDPFMPNSKSMDRFFGMLGDTKAAPQEVSPPIPMDPTPKKEVPSSKLGKSSRFAGLFSPLPDSPASAPEPQLPVRAQSGGPPVSLHDADQEGFQRILKMLGGGGAAAAGGRSHNGTPSQVDASRHMYPAPGQVDASIHSHPMPRQMDPELGHPHAHPTSPPALSRQGFASPPADRDHLLRLMQQVRIGPQSAGNPLQPMNAGPAPPPGLMPEMLARPPPGLVPQKGPNFLDDPAIANMQRPDGEQLRRRPPPGFFDDAPFPQGNQGPMTPGGSRPHQGPNQSQMLPRPPGLEHMPPPGWTGQPPPPQQQQGNGMSHMVPPPPGIPTANRGMNPGFPPGMMPMPGNMPPMNDRQGPQGPQGYPRGPPPGMMPPPGYMGAPPPPGFPPMPHNPEAMMGLGPGSQGPYGPGNPGPQGPPSSRHLLDMLGQPGGADIRGGMVGPGQFR